MSLLQVETDKFPEAMPRETELEKFSIEPDFVGPLLKDLLLLRILALAGLTEDQQCSPLTKNWAKKPNEILAQFKSKNKGSIKAHKQITIIILFERTLTTTLYSTLLTLSLFLLPFYSITTRICIVFCYYLI